MSSKATATGLPSDTVLARRRSWPRCGSVRPGSIRRTKRTGRCTVCGRIEWHWIQAEDQYSMRNFQRSPKREFPRVVNPVAGVSLKTTLHNPESLKSIRLGLSPERGCSGESRGRESSLSKVSFRTTRSTACQQWLQVERTELFPNRSRDPQVALSACCKIAYATLPASLFGAFDLLFVSHMQQYQCGPFFRSLT